MRCGRMLPNEEDGQRIKRNLAPQRAVNRRRSGQWIDEGGSNMTEKQFNRKFWIGAAVGGVIGGVSALLLAPKSGRDLRHDIADGAKQATEKTQQIAQQIGEKTTGLIEAAKDKTVELKETIQGWRAGQSDAETDIEDVSVIHEGTETELETEACIHDDVQEQQKEEKELHFSI